MTARRVVDVRIGDFSRDGVEAPAAWSDTAVGIAARMYMTAGETSVYALVDRVVTAIVDKGIALDYFHGAAAQNFAVSLRQLLLEQRAAFNTPVWANVGVPGRDQQAWACLILGVDDSMKSIEAGWLVESRTFQGGSGSGVNASKIRAAGEPLSDGCGVGSGPISLWMRPTDAIAGVVRSGGRTRRAAKMVILDADHPELMEFIWCKARAEDQARQLQAAGFSISMTGSDAASIPFQNANNSVRVPDAFMQALESNHRWAARYRRSGEDAWLRPASDIWGQICLAAWECGDPGLQFHDTINAMNSCANDGEIVASNPCSEYMWLNDTVCNLASINLMAFLTEDGGFDADRLVRTAQLMVTAMDILVDLTSYPTEHIAETSLRYRTLGLGFTNLGALLMSLGVPYDSDQGRAIAAGIAALLQGAAAAQSQALAGLLGPYPAWLDNQAPQQRVLDAHARAVRHAEHTETFVDDLLLQAETLWSTVKSDRPMRNAQLSVIAPTGTISFLMDCETTGIEPVLGLRATKDLVGGGQLDVGVQDCVRRGVRALQVAGGERSSAATMAQYPRVFQTALGDNVVSPEGHLRMMAAVQPFVSGAISKTVNLPAHATVDDVSGVYTLAHRLGLKSIAIYRDGCKAYQPVTVSETRAEAHQRVTTAREPVEQCVPTTAAFRHRPPGTREGVTHKFELGGEEYYVTVNHYADGMPCELFIKGSKHGSAIGGWVDAFSIAVSLGLQYGVPFETLAAHFRHMNFLPQGLVMADGGARMADSPLDYIFRWIADRHAVVVHAVGGWDGRSCSACGSTRTRWAGSCLACQDCGETSGCS